MFKRNYKEMERKQSISFLKNGFLDFMECGIKVVGITTSLKNKSFLTHTAKCIADSLIEFENKKVLLATPFNFDIIEHESSYDVINFKDLSNRDLNENFNSYKEKYDIILLMLNSLNKDSQSLKCAKFCEKIFSVEKYQNTKYKNFEDMLYVMKVNSLKLDGIISYKG